MTRHHSCRVSPFGHPRIHARLAAPRGISQPPTSFIGSQCQGIHHAPLNTYNTKPKNESPTHTPKKGLHASIRKICITPNTQHHKRCAFRCSQPLSTNQTPHPTTKAGQQHADPANAEPPQKRGTGLLSQSPIVCLMISLTGIPYRLGQVCHVHQTPIHYR